MEVRAVLEIEYRLRRKLADWLCPERIARRQAEATKAEALLYETRSLLHRFWSTAPREGYVKNDWARFQILIEDAAELRVSLAREGVLVVSRFLMTCRK